MRSSGNDETNNDLSIALEKKYFKLRNALSVEFNNCRKKDSTVKVNDVVANAFTTHLNLIAEINRADDEKRFPQEWQERERWSDSVIADMKKNITIYFKRLDRKVDPAIMIDYNKLVNQVDQLAERLSAPKEELRAGRQRQRYEEAPIPTKSVSDPNPAKMSHDRLFQGRSRSTSGPPPKPERPQSKPETPQSTDGEKREGFPFTKRK